MKVVAIVGPFRASNGWTIELNCRKAEEVALDVWRAGAAAICPHKNTRGWDQVLPDAVWLDGYQEILTRCDAVMLVPGWEHSEGSRIEVSLAKQHSIPIFHDIGRLSAWLHQED